MPVTAGLMARTVRGLEWVAAEEIEAAGGAHLELGHRQVTFTVPAGALAPWLDLRTVDDLFVRVGVVRGIGRSPSTAGRLGAAVDHMDLASAVEVVTATRNRPPGLDVVASLDGDRRFSRYDLEDAVGPLAARALGTTFHSRRDAAPPPTGLSLRVAVTDDRAEVMVRLPLRPLHRRAWKVATASGTLHPPVAAALVRLTPQAGWVLDPCCGDGTIAVEAALGRPGVPVVGSDIDAHRLRHTVRNASAAGAGVRAVKADAGHLPFRDRGAVAVITNPPWSRTVGAGGSLAAGLAPLWDATARAEAVALVVEAGMSPLDALSRAGSTKVVEQQIRVAGRLAHLLVTTRGPTGLHRRLRYWRTRSMAEGVTTADGF
jgi:23S rRNA G2445 N2-methylase RlmL